MSQIVFFLVITLTLNKIGCLWPPEYAIQLEVTDTFIISDMFDSDDAEDFSDDDLRLIKDPGGVVIKPGDEKKFYMLDNIAERVNREAAERALKTTTPKGFVVTKAVEYLYDFDDEPVHAEFMDSEDDSSEIKDELNVKHRIKRDDYNYDQLKRDYDAKAAQDAKGNDVLKYVDVTEKEGIKDSAKNIIKFKATQNCTAEETKSIGFNAIRCFFKDMGRMGKKTKKEQKTLLWRFLKLLLIWVGVYVIIAVPSWCTRGWCCCCCRCKFCKPKQTIEAAKQFLAQNPVGVLHVDGKEVTYTPTVYERYAQQRLEKVVLKL